MCRANPREVRAAQDWRFHLHSVSLACSYLFTSRRDPSSGAGPVCICWLHADACGCVALHLEDGPAAPVLLLPCGGAPRHLGKSVLFCLQRDTDQIQFGLSLGMSARFLGWQAFMQRGEKCATGLHFGSEGLRGTSLLQGVGTFLSPIRSLLLAPRTWQAKKAVVLHSPGCSAFQESCTVTPFWTSLSSILGHFPWC